VAIGRKWLETAATRKKWWELGTSQGVLLLAIAILTFSFLLRVPTADQAVLGVLERQAFDTQMNFLRYSYPRPATVDPVLIGIDEHTEDELEEPLAMWHRHFAKTMLALAEAGPALVGLDVVLPPKSFDKFMPGLDLSLVVGLTKLKQVAPLVVSHTVDRQGTLAQIHPPFLRTLGDDTFGIDKAIEDRDRVSRRFSERELLAKDAPFPTFSGRIASVLGKPVTEGYIDFSIGSEVRYIPLQQVIRWHDAGNTAELRRQFAGRVVLIGTVTKDKDRWNLPVGLSDWERNAEGKLDRNQPGIIVHLQTLRSLLGEGLITPIPDWLKWLICAALLGFVFVPSNRRTYVFAFAVAPLLFFSVSVILITAKILIPAVTFLVLLWISVMVGAVADAAKTLVDKNRLRNSFEGSVSPAVMEEMLAGNLSGGVSAKTAEVCVMFTDIRGFTGLSESLSPEEVTGLLTRYFDRMVASVHRCDGTMDKFMGDGMMVFFGAPRALDNPCTNAVRCAIDMVGQLTELNAQFEREGLPRVEIGIGINYGKVVVGNIGSTVRHNYSAIGDAVNVASRVEGMTKRLGRPIVFTDSVRARLGADFDMIDFGEQAIRGHSPMRLWGVNAATPGAAAQQ
jgi:adenylate cyclase